MGGANRSWANGIFRGSVTILSVDVDVTPLRRRIVRCTIGSLGEMCRVPENINQVRTSTYTL
jgi:hypothetical protein